MSNMISYNHLATFLKLFVSVWVMFMCDWFILSKNKRNVIMSWFVFPTRAILLNFKNNMGCFTREQKKSFTGTWGNQVSDNKDNNWKAWWEITFRDFAKVHWNTIESPRHVNLFILKVIVVFLLFYFFNFAINYFHIYASTFSAFVEFY